MQEGFDQILDDAVKHYGSIEPAPDLAARILRRAQLEPVPQRRPWKVALAIALPMAATAALALVLAFRLSLPQAPVAVAKTPALPEVQAVPVAPALTAKAVRTRPHQLKVEAARPLPAPYSKQELALLAFVEQHPEEAMKVAEEQKQPLKPLSQPPIAISRLEVAPLSITALDQEK